MLHSPAGLKVPPAVHADRDQRPLPGPRPDGARSRASIEVPRPTATAPREDPTTLMDASALQLLIPIAGIAAVLFALYLARDVLARDTGTPEMEAVAGTIRRARTHSSGASTRRSACLAVVGALIIGIVIAVVETPDVADVPRSPACRSAS